MMGKKNKHQAGRPLKQAHQGGGDMLKMRATNRTGTLCLKITLTTLSDLHAGSGLGGAGIDALIARDHYDKPIIRWSHFKGLLVEACRDYYANLAKPNDGEKMIATLFGREDPNGASRGLVLGRSFRLVAHQDNLPSLVWGSTGMEEQERCPLEDTLRRVEYLPSNTKFESEIRCPNTKEYVELLNTLLKRVDKLGADRSRGAGLVHITLKNEPKEAKSLLASQLNIGRTPLRVLIKALEPLCFAATGTPGNLIPTHSQISPTAVRGMFARWALDRGYEELADAFIDGRIGVGAAYPVPETVSQVAELEVVPIPLARQSEKPPGQDGELPWWATQVSSPLPKDVLTESSHEKLKRPGAHDYLVTEDGGESWRVFSCPIATAMHNNAGSSQKKQIEQALYSVEEIVEGTQFVLTLDPDEAMSIWLAPMLSLMESNNLWLRAGRGGATVQVVDWLEVKQSGCGTNNDSAATQNSKPTAIRIFVESDLILRAPDFAFHTRLDLGGIQALLAEAGIAAQELGNFSCLKTVSEETTVHGWNQATGRPRAEAIAIRRGSEAIIGCADEALCQEARSALLQRSRCGLGERTQEGFGRLRIDFRPTIVAAPSGKPDIFPDNAIDRLLHKINGEFDEPGFPQYFATSRWQALARAANNTKALDAWIAAACRAVNNNKSTNVDHQKKQEEKIWLNVLNVRTQWDAKALAMLGRLAAKRKQAV